MVRLAEDFVIGFCEEAIARRCSVEIRERLAKFGSELHPDKTRLIEFERYAEARRAKRGDGPPETFDFRGFTHICSKTRRGDFAIRRIMSRKKFRAKLNELRDIWLNVLRRRSQRGRYLTWEKFSKLSRRWLPAPKIIHHYPDAWFARLYLK